MPRQDYSEDRLIQQPTAELLERELGWESVFAYNREDFGPDSLLGRRSDRDVVLQRDLAAALRRLNPDLPKAAYRQALEQALAEDLTKTLTQTNEEKYRLLKDGVPVRMPNADGGHSDRRLKLIDFDHPDRMSAIDFARLRAEFERSPYKHVILLNLQEKLAARLERMAACNPTRINLYERYWAIIQAYNKDKDDAEIQRVFDALMQFNGELDQEERRYLREGLDNEDQLAVFDLLQKDMLTRGERERIKQVAKDLLERLLAGKLRLDHWREKATAQAQIKVEIIDHLLLHLPPERYDPAEIEQTANRVFAHLFTSAIGGERRLYH